MFTSLECDSADLITNLMEGRGNSRSRFQSTGTNLRRSSLFSLYAKIFRLLLTRWDRSDVDENVEEDEYTRELDSLVLPSNEEWRLRVYYRLVELQRENDAEATLAADDVPEDFLSRYYLVARRLESEEDCTDVTLRMTEEPLQLPASPPAAKKTAAPRRKKETSSSKKWDWEPDTRVIYPLTPRSSRRLDSIESSSSIMLDTGVEPGWRLRDILLAAKLLLEQQQDEFADESEMRRVFGLVYDVLRYKQILDKALDDVGFWLRHGQLKKRDKVVWLLLYDMQGRKFARVGGTAAIVSRNEALRSAGLLEIERALLELKTRLAASLSRLRIGGSALSLDELLPMHLRTAEGVTWGEEGSIASGWVNSAKLPSRQQFVDEMRKLGLTLCSSCSPTSELEEDQYVFDPMCPKVVNLHEKARERLAVSQLVRTHGFVFLERSLCIGAAALVHAIRVGKLCGPVILTHSLAPRHTGYLAELLADVEEAGRLLAFGLGDNRNQHQAYLENLGITLQRCKLFSERYTSAPASAEVERATIVLATPPCSYTGVRDVVDLAIARGGDLGLLESLTSIEAEMPQQPRALLAEQMTTLRYALTRPNTQLLVYEVHTMLPSETTEMIEQAVEHANKLALDKFQKEHPQRKRSPGRDTMGKRTKSGKRSHSFEQLGKSQQHSDDSKSNLESEDEAGHIDVPIPESDLFEISTLNDVYELDCSKQIDQGSFIVVVKRKEMMQFNSLFMIKVAEAKGVFGDTKDKQLAKTPELQQAAQPTPELASESSKRKKVKKEKVHFDRLSAPTHASTIRALRDKKAPCPRHQHHIEAEETVMETQQQPAAPTVKTSSPSAKRKAAMEVGVADAQAGDNSAKEIETRCDRDANVLDVSPHCDYEKMHTEDMEDTEDELSDNDESVEVVPSAEKARNSLFHSSNNPDSFFDIPWRPSITLPARRQIFPAQKRPRLNRIAFKCRLETVLEHSPGFSYLFPED